MLRVFDVSGKLLNQIKSIYVNSLACVREKEGEGECFRIDRGVRQGYIMSFPPPLAFQCIYGPSDEGGENGDGEEGSEISGRGKRVEIACPLVYR